MAYVFVLLRDGPHADDADVYAEAHERFIDSLIERNLVLLGGAFRGPAADVAAGYVLRCPLDEAHRIAEEDPFVRHGVVRADPLEWDLVGINPDAVDPGVVVRPATMRAR